MLKTYIRSCDVYATRRIDHVVKREKLESDIKRFITARLNYSFSEKKGNYISKMLFAGVIFTRTSLFTAARNIEHEFEQSLLIL